MKFFAPSGINPLLSLLRREAKLKRVSYFPLEVDIPDNAKQKQEQNNCTITVADQKIKETDKHDGGLS